MSFIIAMLYCILGLWSSNALAAITNIGALFTANSTASTTSLSGTTSADLEINNVGVFVVAGDNLCTSGTGTDVITDGNFFTSATIDGNAMTKIAEACSEIDDPGGGAGTGIMTAIYIYRATATLASGVTVTFNFSSAITSKAALGREAGVTAGNTLAAVGSTQYIALDSLDPSAMVISGLTSVETYFLRMFGMERDTGGVFTPTASYTSFGVADADTTVAVTSVQTRGEFRILTGTGDTSDPAHSSATDSTNIFVALRETAVTTVRPISPIMFQ